MDSPTKRCIEFDILKRDVLKYFEVDKFVGHFLFAFMEYDITILLEERVHAYLTCFKNDNDFCGIQSLSYSNY